MKTKQSWFKNVLVCLSASFLLFSCKTFDSVEDSSAINASLPTESDCGRLDQKNRPNPAHCRGPVYVDGKYTFNESQIIAWYGYGFGIIPDSLNHKMFGTTVVTDDQNNVMQNIRTGKKYIIRDLHYLVDNNKVGFRPIPVTSGTSSEADTVSTGYRTPVKGSNILDQAIRESSGLTQNDPIFAAALYLYPADRSAPLSLLGKIKGQGSIGHMSVYLGDGVSKHSPQGMHGERWEAAIGGEPSNIYTVSLDGVEQPILNQNMRAWSLILNTLNGGPNFPLSYEKDLTRVSTLQGQTEFARKWMEGGSEAEKLKTNPDWATYCAEFANMAINLGFNIPLTEQGFADVWSHQNMSSFTSNQPSRQYSSKLFKTIKRRYLEEILDKNPTDQDVEDFKFIDEDFTPLWKKIGVSPLSTKMNEGFPFPYDTTTDLSSAIVENFANWTVYGPTVSALVIAGLSDIYKDRVGTSSNEFFQTAVPIIVAGFIADASTRKLTDEAAVNQYLDQFFYSQPSVPENLKALIKPALEAQKTSMINQNAVSVNQAWENYREAVKPYKTKSMGWKPEKIRNVSGDLVPYFNSPPSLFHRMYTGLRQPNEYVGLKIVGTIFHATHLREKNGSESGSYTVDQIEEKLPSQINP